MAVETPSPTPLTGIRRVIASRMMESLSNTAQLTYHGDADISGLITRRSDWKAKGYNISLEACLIHALVESLKRYPDFNGRTDDDSIYLTDQIELSIAVATPAGLMTPVLRRADEMTLEEIADNRRQLVHRAVSGKLSVSDMKGGSFTISNLGHTRVRYFTPILNAGQIALLGIGSLYQTVALTPEGELRQRSLLPLSLTADHRIVDGEPAGVFLSSVCDGLENCDLDV